MRYWAFSIIILLLSPVAFGQWGSVDDSAWIAIDSSNIQDVLADSSVWPIDPPKPKCPDFVEIFYIDTVGWYLDTTKVEAPCPKYAADSPIGCLVYHWKDKIEWKPKIEIISVFKIEPSTFEHLERWQIRKQ